MTIHMPLSSDTRAAPAGLSPLTPDQARAAGQVETILKSSGAVFVNAGPGSGKSLLLRHLQARLGGKVLRVQDAFEAFAGRDPAAVEEALIDLLERTHAVHDIIYFDDLGMILPHGQFADRPGYASQLIRAYLARMSPHGKKIVISNNGGAAQYYEAGFGTVGLADFSPADYRQILEDHAGRGLDGVNFDELYRVHRKLTGTALAFVGDLIRKEDWAEADADRIVALVDEFIIQSNVELSEVAPVSLDTLVGVESLVEILDRTILIPMTQPALARELGLKPKRGVLLYGEPGTGKTTIGRALAQRMRGKFFMIDGTFRPDESNFHSMFDRVLASAQRSSPSVIFIDDADVIFRNGQTVGLARKLLSKLDGLESESQSQVCVVMTAMDVSDMPPALVRSGRVEVWLEMKLPDGERRIEMIRYFAPDFLKALDGADTARLAEATEGFTPADIRGLVGDARAHLGYDRHLSGEVQSFEDYLLLAAGEIAARKAVLRTL